ncbi:tumor necrosis factor receptor superfamily member 25 [Podarcis raffonei]|uniref:tumor necrosis factor receptor superfamily member 25 n=1 Tax=Podarcis raffonei TaxID=65483 RepID=UPI00232910E1|nr:tumor necrosis factor receptor superfamily member 25 [Podarcis raffonei]
MLLAAAFIVYCIRRFAPRAEKSYSTSPCIQTGQSTKHLCNGTVQMPPLFLHSEPPAASLAEKEKLVNGAPPICGLLQGRNMYAVIDAVPVRRWKEFVRGLGLRDREIELVELEHSQFREQQYEMLKCWCQQQQGPSTDAIFTVLESMQLGGCAQELREQLHANS